MEILTQQQQYALEKAGACAHWERLTPTGRCVRKWWAGPPVTQVVEAVGGAIGLAAVGLVLVQLSKFSLLNPVIKLIQGRMPQARAVSNRTRRRRSSRRRRSRRGRRRR